MGFVYRAKTGGFYNDAFEDAYRKAGTWPGFYVRVTDDDYLALMEGQEKGKIIVPDKHCYPVLQDRPAPSPEELIAQAEEKRNMLTDTALQSVAVIQLKQMSGRKLTAEETTRLNNVLDYIETLEAIDPKDPPASWPELAA